MSQGIKVITVSRQFGTGSGDFCRALAQRLGFVLFDRELLSALARRMKTSEEVLDTYEKMRYGSQEFFLTSFAKRYAFLESEIIESKRYIASLKRVIRELTSLGKVILLGRGGQCILHGEPGCLHLRIVAETDYRLDRLGRLEAYAANDRKQLLKLIRRKDDYRSDFTRKHFQRDINDPTLYHLVINFSLLPPEDTLTMVAGLVG